MSPSRSNTTRRPSGLTSTFIHVPSSVSNESGVDGPQSPATSHLSAGFCCAIGGSRSRDARQTVAIFKDSLLDGFLHRFVVEAAPKVPGGDRAIRFPRFAELAHPLRGRLLPHAVRALDRIDDPEIADRQDIGSLETEDEEHFRGPAADALDLRQRRDDFFVREGVDRIERDSTGAHLLGEVPQIAGFLPADTRRPKLVVRERRECCWCHRPAHRVDKTGVDCRRRLRRELLKDDRANEHREVVEPIARRAKPAAAVLLDDGGEDGIATHERASRLRVIGCAHRVGMISKSLSRRSSLSTCCRATYVVEVHVMPRAMSFTAVTVLHALASG